MNGGGIGWMRDHPVDSGLDSARMNLNALDAAHQTGARRFIGASSCVYPRDCRCLSKKAKSGTVIPNQRMVLRAVKRLMMDLGAAYHRQYGLSVVFIWRTYMAW